MEDKEEKESEDEAPLIKLGEKRKEREEEETA